MMTFNNLPSTTPTERRRKSVIFADDVAPEPYSDDYDHDHDHDQGQDHTSSPSKDIKPNRAHRRMTEPRARAARHKGQQNFHPEITSLLYAFGDDPHPLPETVRLLDEITTDFIIETCHAAARAATVSRRQKIKVEDFKWAVRGDERMVGRVRELLGMERELKEARRQFDTGEGKVGLERGGGSGGVGRKRKRREGEEVLVEGGVGEKGEGGGKRVAV